VTTARRARFVVHGLVQGVNFRTAAVRECSTRGLTGRVWNRDDGAVELIAEGDAVSLDGLAAWLARGPHQAEVRSVDRTALGGVRCYADFAITYDQLS
jgi:acylphosphatase